MPRKAFAALSRISLLVFVKDAIFCRYVSPVVYVFAKTANSTAATETNTVVLCINLY